MVKELVIYPDERIHMACTDVRSFDETLFTLLQDMKDTIDNYKLPALSAIQVAHPFNIVVLKDGETYKEYINPRILKVEEEIESTESSSYYPNVTITVPRYKKIKLYYEDRFAKPHYEDIEDEEYSTLMQQMIDHLFGGTILDKISKDQKEQVLEKLKNDGLVENLEVCPTFSKKDYFVSFSDKLLFLMGLSLFSPLFLEKSTISSLATMNKILFPIILILMVGFFFYAQYESKKYSQCSSCQIGNNIGVIVKRTILALIFFVASIFIL